MNDATPQKAEMAECLRCRENKPIAHANGPLCGDCFDHLRGVAAQAMRDLPPEPPHAFESGLPLDVCWRCGLHALGHPPADLRTPPVQGATDQHNGGNQ